jgi:hypothetical protein
VGWADGDGQNDRCFAMKFHLHDHARPLFDDPEITGNMLRRLAIERIAYSSPE